MKKQTGSWTINKWKSLGRRLGRCRRGFLVYVTNHIISGVISRRIRMCWYRYVMHYEVGSSSSILPAFRIAESGGISIGNHSVINNGCCFDNRHPIRIGDNVSISYGVMIFTEGHDIDDPDFQTKGAGVVIEDYVWLCAEVILLPGVTIGKGAVVLTGSVVARDVPPYAVVGGNPAKLIRERKRDLRYQLNWNPRVPLFG